VGDRPPREGDTFQQVRWPASRPSARRGGLRLLPGKGSEAPARVRQALRKPRPHKHLLGALAAVLVAGLLAASARASSGLLIVTADTTLTEDHNGSVLIDADGVTLDCAGHRVFGPAGDEGILVWDHTDVTIRHCDVSGFYRGIVVNLSSRVVLEGNRSSANEWGIWVAETDGAELRENTAADNEIVGFYLGSARDSSLVGNRAERNGGNGFQINQSLGVELLGNGAEDNGQAGFLIGLSRGSRVQGNQAQRNTVGLSVDHSSDSSLEANLASDNSNHGFLLSNADGARLNSNGAAGNGRDGFHVDRSSDVLLDHNHAEGNGGRPFRIESSDVVLLGNTTTAGLRPVAPVGFEAVVEELVAFLGLASSLWLGLYLVGQPNRTPVVWLTGLTLWSIGGIYLSDFISINQPAGGFGRQLTALLDLGEAGVSVGRFLLLGWVSKLAVAFWNHATTLMRPGGLTPWRRGIVVAGYALAAAAIGIEILQPELLAEAGSASDATRAWPSGSLYPPFALALVVYSGLCLRNLIASFRTVRGEIVRRQVGLLIGSTLLAVASGLIVVVRGWLGVPIPTATQGLVLLLAVILLGYGVAQYSAIIEGRTIRRHFTFSFVSVGLVTLLYFVVSYLSSLSFGVRTAAFAFVILLAVVTHSLAGNVRAVLDYFFVEPATRRVLQAYRSLPIGMSQRGRLDERLELMLSQLCDHVRASFGLATLESADSVRLVAACRWGGPGELDLDPATLTADDLRPLEAGTLAQPLEEAALLAPLYNESIQIGAVILGHPVNAAQFSPDDLEVIGYATDRMAESIRANRAEGEAIARIPRGTVEPWIGLADGEPSIATVEGALRRMHDSSFLGETPLADLETVRRRLQPGAQTTVDRGRAVHQVLTEAVHKLRPEGKQPTEATREWHHFMVLHEAYLMDRPNREVMAELYISEGTFNRRRREAIDAVTRILQEQEAVVASPA
jgi:parallel beta-helix repeat protein